MYRPQPQGRQQLTMNEAIVSLQSMFETIDLEVIRMVLEACGGSMESTIESLLQITASQNDVSSTQQQQQQQQHQVSLQSSNSFDEMKAPGSNGLNLPDDFLRPPSYFANKSISQQSPQQNSSYNNQRQQEKQIVDDEIFAKNLQHDLFLAEIQENPEWVLEEAQNVNRSKSVDNSNNNNNNSNNKKLSNFSWKGFKTNQDNKSKSAKEIKSQPSTSQSSTVQRMNSTPINSSSDTDARKTSFKERFNSLTNSGKARLINLAEKLQKNKQQKKKFKINDGGTLQYTQLTSLDDEPLIDGDDDDDNNNNHIITSSDRNQNTYTPPKSKSKSKLSP